MNKTWKIWNWYQKLNFILMIISGLLFVIINTNWEYLFLLFQILFGILFILGTLIKGDEE